MFWAVVAVVTFFGVVITLYGILAGIARWAFRQ